MIHVSLSCIIFTKFTLFPPSHFRKFKHKVLILIYTSTTKHILLYVRPSAKSFEFFYTIRHSKPPKILERHGVGVVEGTQGLDASRVTFCSNSTTIFFLKKQLRKRKRRNLKRKCHLQNKLNLEGQPRPFISNSEVYEEESRV